MKGDWVVAGIVVAPMLEEEAQAEERTCADLMGQPFQAEAGSEDDNCLSSAVQQSTFLQPWAMRQAEFSGGSVPHQALRRTRPGLCSNCVRTLSSKNHEDAKDRYPGSPSHRLQCNGALSAVNIVMSLEYILDDSHSAQPSHVGGISKSRPSLNKGRPGIASAVGSAYSISQGFGEFAVRAEEVTRLGPA